MKAMEVHQRIMQAAGILRASPQKAVLALSFIAPLVTIVATNAGIATNEFWIYVAFYFPPTIISMAFVGIHRRVLRSFVKIVTATICLSNFLGFLLALTPIFMHGGRWYRPIEADPAFSHLLWISVAIWAFTVMLVFVMSVIMVDPDIQRQRRASELEAGEAMDRVVDQISRIFDNSRKLQDEIRSDGAKLETALSEFRELSKQIGSTVSAQQQKLSKMTTELAELEDVEPHNKKLLLRLLKERRAGTWRRVAFGILIGLAANSIFSFGHSYLSQLQLDSLKAYPEPKGPASNPSVDLGKL